MCKTLILPVVVALALVAGSARADLVGHWTFDEGQGTTAYDSSGNDHHGTLQGDPQWVTGYIGGALELDGTGDYVEVPDDEGLHLWETFTLAAWIYQLESGSSRIIDKIGAGTANGPHLDTHPGVRLRSCSGTCISTTTDHTLEEWHHVAVTFDEGDVKIYLDGAVAAEGSVPSPLAGNSLPLRIGAASDGGSLFHGIIDDVRVYNHALTETEIGAAMAGEAVPFAFGPSPGNGSMMGQTSVTLQWRPGDFAVSHDVYFGESFDDVNQATPESDVFQGNQTGTELALPDLTPGATYYWRVDEVNDANAASPWRGTVWSFWIQPATAWNPAPADGVEFVDPEGELTWQPGMGTLFHTVYLGASFDEVDEAIAGGFMIADAAYNPGPLELDTTYYWRVDEFTMTGTVKGEVWSFRTMPEIPVSDPNLALWYRLDEAQGSRAIDWSGHGNHAGITGEPLWTQDGYDWAALQLGGRNYLTVPNSDQMKLTGSGAYSVALHIKLENTQQQAIFYHGLGCSTWASWFLGVAGGEPGIATVPDSFVFGVREANGADYVSVSAPARAGAWVHVAATYDGSMLRLYIDGQEMNVAAVPLPWDSDEANQLWEAVRRMGTDCAAVLREGDRIEMLDFRAAGDGEVFQNILDRAAREMTLAILGQTLTSGTGAAESMLRTEQCRNPRTRDSGKYLYNESSVAIPGRVIGDDADPLAAEQLGVPLHVVQPRPYRLLAAANQQHHGPERCNSASAHPLMPRPCIFVRRPHGPLHGTVHARLLNAVIAPIVAQTVTGTQYCL